MVAELETIHVPTGGLPPARLTQVLWPPGIQPACKKDHAEPGKWLHSLGEQLPTWWQVNCQKLG